MGKRFGIVIASIVLAGIFALLAVFATGIPSHRFLFAFFYLYLVLFPGYLLARLLLPWTRGFLRILVAFILGTTLCFAILFGIALFRADIRVLGYLVPVVSIALSFHPRFLRPAMHSEGSEDEERRYLSFLGKKELAILLVLLGAVTFLILHTGDPIYYTNDSADHIAYVRTITHSREVFPEQWYYRDGGKLTHDIRRGLLHALWGTINSFTGRVDAAAIWPLTSVIASGFFIIALLFAAIALFRSAPIGLISAFLFVFFYQGGLRDIALVRMAYAFFFGKIFYVTALAFLLLYLKKPEGGFLLLVGCSVFAATCTHINFLWMTLFLLFVVALVKLVHERGMERATILFRRVPLLGAVILATNIPYVALRYIRDYAPNNPIYMHVQGVLYLTDRIYALNPVFFFQEVGILGALAMFSIPVLWKRTHEDESLRLLLYGLISYYILVFNPLWFPLLHEKMLYLLVRFEFLIPSMTVCAYLIYELWRKTIGKSSNLSRFGTAFGWACVVILLGFPLAHTPQNCMYGPRKLASLREYSLRNLDDLYEYINTSCPPGGVFLSDVFTSFSIPAFTDQYVVCSLDQHSIPNDSTAEIRIADCREIYTPTTPIDRIRDILDKYDVNYVVINGRIPADLRALYWRPNADISRSVIERYRGFDPLLNLVYESRDLAVFKFDNARLRSDVASDEKLPPFLGDSVRIADMRSFAESGQPGILIEKVVLGRDAVKRGDTLQVHITWVVAEKQPLQRYAAYLRFDTAFKKTRLYRESYGKPYRKVLERIERERYRFRVDLLPLAGVYPPDTWPPLRLVHDDAIVTIPRDIAPGDYCVSLKMGITPEFPNYHIGDILTDKDYYGGVAVGHILIE